ncbi:hypothetical protein HDV05_003613 [Chytridiales sp. JEL 0842]|nr:hypothetical protein HDV05_003613 [Chytridiales sp. JEL 0842]
MTKKLVSKTTTASKPAAHPLKKTQQVKPAATTTKVTKSTKPVAAAAATAAVSKQQKPTTKAIAKKPAVSAQKAERKATAPAKKSKKVVAAPPSDDDEEEEDDDENVEMNGEGDEGEEEMVDDDDISDSEFNKIMGKDIYASDDEDEDYNQDDDEDDEEGDEEDLAEDGDDDDEEEDEKDYEEMTKEERAALLAGIESSEGEYSSDEEELQWDEDNTSEKAQDDAEPAKPSAKKSSSKAEKTSSKKQTTKDDGISTQQPVVKLDDSSKTSKKRTLDEANEEPTGVVYLGRIPHGFYEKEMRGYFSQFGQVLRLRLSRNKKTGKSKHFAFIEFENEKVAKIVAETMDGYLLFSHILKCKVVPQDKLHPETFVGCDKKFKVLPRYNMAKAKHNKAKTEAEVKKNIQKLVVQESKKRAKLAALGIDYDFPGYTSLAKPAEKKEEKAVAEKKVNKVVAEKKEEKVVKVKKEAVPKTTAKAAAAPIETETKKAKKPVVAAAAPAVKAVKDAAQKPAKKAKKN